MILWNEVLLLHARLGCFTWVDDVDDCMLLSIMQNYRVYFTVSNNKNKEMQSFDCE
jgi:hypothetical protein